MVSHNLVLHERTKHVELDIHFVHKIVTSNKLNFHHIPGTTQVVGTLIKPLSLMPYSKILNPSSKFHPCFKHELVERGYWSNILSRF